MKSAISKKQNSQGTRADGSKPKRAKKGDSRAQVPGVAPVGGKAAKKATSARKRPKTPDTAERTAAASPREGSKTVTVLDLMKRPGGATLKELMKVTGWKPHSVRGFVSGTLSKKMGLTVNSAKSKDGERSYSIAS